jgi:aspartate/methionine/tyrosine aminotransferase
MLNQTITINGFSKAYSMTGWRVGYAVGAPALIKQMATMQMYINICPPSMSQMAAIAALEGNQKCLNDMLQKYKKRRNFLTKRLSDMDISCRKPDGAFYAFPNISHLGTSDEIWKLFMEKAKVSTTPGNVFGQNGEGYLRLSYANSLSNIEVALNRIENILGAVR